MTGTEYLDQLRDMIMLYRFDDMHDALPCSLSAVLELPHTYGIPLCSAARIVSDAASREAKNAFDRTVARMLCNAARCVHGYTAPTDSVYNTMLSALDRSDPTAQILRLHAAIDAVRHARFGFQKGEEHGSAYGHTVS